MPDNLIVGLVAPKIPFFMELKFVIVVTRAPHSNISQYNSGHFKVSPNLCPVCQSESFFLGFHTRNLHAAELGLEYGGQH